MDETVRAVSVNDLIKQRSEDIALAFQVFITFCHFEAINWILTLGIQKWSKYSNSDAATSATHASTSHES